MAGNKPLSGVCPAPQRPGRPALEAAAWTPHRWLRPIHSPGAKPPWPGPAPSSRRHREGHCRRAGAVHHGNVPGAPRSLGQSRAVNHTADAHTRARAPVQLGPGPGRGGSPGRSTRRGEGKRRIAVAPWIRPQRRRCALCVQPGFATSLGSCGANCSAEVLSRLAAASEGGFELAKATQPTRAAIQAKHQSRRWRAKAPGPAGEHFAATDARLRFHLAVQKYYKAMKFGSSGGCQRKGPSGSLRSGG